MSNSKTIIVRDCTFMWAKLTKAVDPFNTGTPKYELKIVTENADTAMTWVQQGLSVKRNEDGYYCNLRRSTHRKDGTPNPAPTVVDADKQEISSMIGNGSKGNVKLFIYTNKTTNKVSYEFLAVQVMDLVEYKTDEVDF